MKQNVNNTPNDAYRNTNELDLFSFSFFSKIMQNGYFSPGPIFQGALNMVKN